MRIPNTINKTTLNTYKVNEEWKFNNENLQSHNIQKWDIQLPRSLQEICIQTIANNWEEKPILDEIPLSIDRFLLLDTLPTNLSLDLTIPKIKDEIYWKKCFEERWPNNLPTNVAEIEIILKNEKITPTQTNSRLSSRRSSNNKSLTSIKPSSLNDEVKARTWKEYFIEKHIGEYLENLKPEDYNPEKIKELSDLCGSFMKSLQINQMQCSQNSATRIPLNAVLTGFKNLTELSICYKQTYAGEKFSWNILKTNYPDIKLFAKGLEKLRLNIIRLTNSDIDCEKLIIILKSLLKHDNLKTLDFSHCKISNNGALALSKFIIEVPLSALILTNNKISAKGVEGLCYALCQQSCKIKQLDLKLNKICDNGGNLLVKALPFAPSLTSLHIGGCGLTKNFLLEIMLMANNALALLDISNNNISEELGQVILKALDFNTKLKNLDIRMCKINSETEYKIQQKINSKRRTSEPSKLDFPNLNDLIRDKEQLENLELISTIENILN